MNPLQLYLGWLEQELSLYNQLLATASKSLEANEKELSPTENVIINHLLSMISLMTNNISRTKTQLEIWERELSNMGIEFSGAWNHYYETQGII